MNPMLKEAEYHLVNCGAFEEAYRDRGLFYDVTQHAVFQVDAVGREILEHWSGQSDEAILAALSEKYTPEEIREALQELEAAIAPRGSSTSEPRVDPGITRIKLHVCHDCNMRCRYCYAWNDEGVTFYHGTGRETMTPEVGEAVVNLILKNASSDSLPLLTFHGGEPMLYYPLIKRVVDYAEERAAQVGQRIRFSLATNGTIFKPEYADFFAQHNVNVCISLDGDEQGNAMRVFPNDRPAFPVIVENLRRFRQAGCVVTTQATVHHRNLNLVRAAKLAREMGAVSVLFNLNRECDGEHTLSELDVWQLMREFDDLIRWEFSFSQRQPQGNGSSFTFVRNLDGYYRALATRERRFYYCIYGSNAVSVAPNGDVYVCEYHMGNTKYALGNVLHDERPGHPQEYILQLAVCQREPCRSCWARYICGGPCPYEGLQLFGDPARVAPKFCDLYRSAVESMIAAYARNG